MTNKINPRYIAWGLTLLVLAAVWFVYKTDPGTDKISKAPPVISEAAIERDFIAMKNISIPVKPILGGQFMTDELLFQDSFKGRTGDIFYARLEDGHVLVTVKYRIKSLTAPPIKAVYEAVQTMEDDFVPTGDYHVNRIERYEIKG